MAFFSFSLPILKSLFKKPATLMYPVIAREFYPNTRGKIVFNEETCTYCTLCQKKCPTGAITVNREEKKWKLEVFKCIVCNNCVGGCPKDSLTMDPKYSAPVANTER